MEAQTVMYQSANKAGRPVTLHPAFDNDLASESSSAGKAWPYLWQQFSRNRVSLFQKFYRISQGCTARDMKGCWPSFSKIPYVRPSLTRIPSRSVYWDSKLGIVIRCSACTTETHLSHRNMWVPNVPQICRTSTYEEPQTDTPKS